MSAIVMPEIKIGEHLRIARERCGFSQTEVAEYVGVTQTEVSRWERGKKYPDVCEWTKLAKILDQDWMLDLRLLPSACTYTLADHPT